MIRISPRVKEVIVENPTHSHYHSLAAILVIDDHASYVCDSVQLIPGMNNAVAVSAFADKWKNHAHYIGKALQIDSDAMAIIFADDPLLKAEEIRRAARKS